MKFSFKPYLELIRVPLTLTAVADCYAGFCLAVAARGNAPPLWTAFAAAATSIMIYWMGMATNDLFDVNKDRIRHPHRPLVREGVKASHAAFLSGALAVGAVMVAMAVSTGAALTAVVLIVLALLNNVGGKQVPIVGSLLMGSCRSLNLLIGILAVIPFYWLVPFSWDQGQIQFLLAMVVLGLYVTGITAVSLLEDREPRVRSFLWMTIPIFFIPLLLIALAGNRLEGLLNAGLLAFLLARSILKGIARILYHCRQVPGGNSTPQVSTLSGSSIGFTGGKGTLTLNDASSSDHGHSDFTGIIPRKNQELHPAEEFVKNSLLGIFLVDAGFLLANDLTRQAAAEYGLLILAWLWRRRWLKSSP